MIKEIEISGKPTLPIWIFIGGKAAGYFTWALLAAALMGFEWITPYPANFTTTATYLLLAVGSGFIVLSSLALGKDIRIGLPTHKTVLRTKGIYKISRNPMYIGVHMVTIASVIYTMQWWIAIPGALSLYVYHKITLGEEKFLAERFGNSYHNYRQKTRRYF